MFGHLLHVKGTSSGFLIGTQFDKIISSGAFAVVVFFGLSGIALRYQTDRYGLNARWLAARVIRLMPVYLITLFPPIIGCYLIGIQISYPTYGFVFAILGLQAFSSSIGIPPVNGPLWSLSVELYLSASLLAIGRLKKFPAYFGILFLVVANFLLPGQSILQGLPIFLYGFLLPGLKLNLGNKSELKLGIILIPISVLLLSPSSVQSKFPIFLNFLICTFLAGFVITWTLLVANKREGHWAKLSQRSYSLYAVHFPIILFIDKILFSERHASSAGQVILSLIAICLATEVLYQYVELPSIKYSRKFLKTSL
jgi:peptidoglycan/LPS O-acetylase OafA/YrhL